MESYWSTWYISAAVVGVMVLFGLLMATLIVLAIMGRLSVPGQGIHLVLFAVITGIVGANGKGVERPVKSLRVEADDSALTRKYRDFLVEWDKPRLRLPE